MSLILLYHRVTRLESDPQLLAVNPEHFEEHLRVLKHLATPSRMDALVGKLRQSRIEDRDVAVTFDDGYADNSIEAAPLLTRYEIPATFFVTTALTNSSREFFWDELDRILLTPGQLPPTLSFGDYRAELHESATYTVEECRRHVRWNVLDTQFPTTRQRVYSEAISRVHQGTVAQRETWMEELRGSAGVSDAGRESHRMMTWEEMRNVASDGLICIGGHTVDHPVLSTETLDSQQHQISANKAALETTLGRPISGFSYPFGTRRDFSQETMSLVRDAGYGFACANFPGRVTAQSDPFRLPRFIVRDWPGEEFERRLREWFSTTGSPSTRVTNHDIAV